MGGLVFSLTKHNSVNINGKLLCHFIIWQSNVSDMTKDFTVTKSLVPIFKYSSQTLRLLDTPRDDE